MRKALATLPWVEYRTIETDVDSRQVKFGVNDKSKFDADALRQALKGQRFPEMTVKSGP